MTAPQLAELILASAEKMSVDLLSTFDWTDEVLAEVKALAPAG